MCVCVCVCVCVKHKKVRRMKFDLYLPIASMLGSMMGHWITIAMSLILCLFYYLTPNYFECAIVLQIALSNQNINDTNNDSYLISYLIFIFYLLQNSLYFVVILVLINVNFLIKELRVQKPELHDTLRKYVLKRDTKTHLDLNTFADDDGEIENENANENENETQNNDKNKTQNVKPIINITNNDKNTKQTNDLFVKEEGVITPEIKTNDNIQSNTVEMIETKVKTENQTRVSGNSEHLQTVLEKDETLNDERNESKNESENESKNEEQNENEKTESNENNDIKENKDIEEGMEKEQAQGGEMKALNETNEKKQNTGNISKTATIFYVISWLIILFLTFLYLLAVSIPQNNSIGLSVILLNIITSVMAFILFLSHAVLHPRLIEIFDGWMLKLTNANESYAYRI